jgi:hypothetical protein
MLSREQRQNCQYRRQGIGYDMQVSGLQIVIVVVVRRIGLMIMDTASESENAYTGTIDD